jgi:transcriptional regulator with XRE-family HTH domain
VPYSSAAECCAKFHFGGVLVKSLIGESATRDQEQVLRRNLPDGKDGRPSFLRMLREKNLMSQEELGKRIGASRKQILRIEQKNPHKLLMEEIVLFTKGLGYRLSDVIQLLEAGRNDDFWVLKRSMEEPKTIVSFGEGRELRTLISGPEGDWAGLVNLDPRKSLSCNELPIGELVWGIVFKGTLLLDALGVEKVFKEKDCFRFKGSIPFQICNTDSFYKLSIFLFSISFSPDSFKEMSRKRD